MRQDAQRSHGSGALARSHLGHQSTGERQRRSHHQGVERRDGGLFAHSARPRVLGPLAQGHRRPTFGTNIKQHTDKHALDIPFTILPLLFHVVSRSVDRTTRRSSCGT